ncbi:MAG: HlyD family efflux transporter periplasmic adaptor subunit [Planctomycetota bacterium]
MTVITAAVGQPETGGWIVGVVRPYREDQIAFEVGGRLVAVEDLGTELRGPTLDDDDHVIAGQEGEPIARVETTRYDQALQSAQLALASAQKGLAARRIEADMAATSELEQAAASLRIAEQDHTAAVSNERTTAARLTRTREQFAQQIASQAQLDVDQSAQDAAAATLESAHQAVLAATSGLASARSKAELKKAQVEQTMAEIAELEQRVRNAQQDLADCTLLAPFSGRITAVHTGRGGMVQRGTPVVTLTAMNPMQVSVTVSAERSRALIQGEQVALRPRELDGYVDGTDGDTVYGVVFGKAEVADAATRTYRIDIMVRNRRRSRTPREVDGHRIYAVDRFMPVMRAEAGVPGPLFVGAACVRVETDGTFVYRLPGMAGFQPRSAPMDAVLKPERVPVHLESERLTFVNFKFVRVRDDSAVAEGDALICDPRPEHVDGVTLARYDWMLRPGDLVPVRLAPVAAPPGVYVPVDAIVSVDGQHSVFVVEDDRCRRVPVTAHESVGDRRRITGDDVTAGRRIVHEGAHYLGDGEPVRVVESVF